ncbi:DUF2185 domain-containing protein [soil metagenome]
MRIPAFIDRAWRGRFGKYTIDDPRPIADGAPYTYFLPSENELLALAPGDQTKIVFRSHPPGRKFDAERMWVTLATVNGDELSGSLDNIPADMPQLRLGDMVSFARSDVISILWNEDRAVRPPSAPDHREYWDRCLVDACVVDDGVAVHYLYREEPEAPEPDDTYPDSGWRLRGDYRDISEEQLDARETRYLALGVVLNVDDSWLPLIDAPVGSAFLRDWETGKFVAEG